VLSIPLHMRDPKEREMWLRSMNRAARDVATLKVRVDENSLKRAKLDVLPALIEAINHAEAANPKLQKEIAPLFGPRSSVG
jgi:hypothetical protein